MARGRWREVLLGAVCVWAGGGISETVMAQSEQQPPVPSPQERWEAPSAPICTIEQLLQMCPEQLDSLYRQCSPAPVPCGKVRGRAILFPGTRMARPASRAARAVWQGKVFDGDGTSAINRFFGLRMIRAEVYQGISWMDGQPALILDYGRTSFVYARYRDEIRQVNEGLYLGVMYDRTKPTPDVRMYFALQAN